VLSRRRWLLAGPFAFVAAPGDHRERPQHGLIDGGEMVQGGTIRVI